MNAPSNSILNHLMWVKKENDCNLIETAKPSSNSIWLDASTTASSPRDDLLWCVIVSPPTWTWQKLFFIFKIEEKGIPPSAWRFQYLSAIANELYLHPPLVQLFPRSQVMPHSFPSRYPPPHQQISPTCDDSANPSYHPYNIKIVFHYDPHCKSNQDKFAWNVTYSWVRNTPA